MRINNVEHIRFTDNGLYYHIWSTGGICMQQITIIADHAVMPKKRISMARYKELKLMNRGGGTYTPTGTTTGTGVAVGTPAPKMRKLSSTRKYVCPNCGMSVRATRDVRIMCVDCMEIMEKAED